MLHKPLLFLVLLAPLTLAAPQPTTDSSTGDEIIETSGLRRNRLAAQVDRSIKKAVKYLLARQNADGSWPAEDEANDSEGGRTALLTLALLSAGESHQSPAVAKAIEFLKKTKPEKVPHATYSIALRAAVYSQIPEAARKRELIADLQWLQKALIDKPPWRGMYGYSGGRAGTGAFVGDFSNSQYGVLGVWYAANAGLEVPLSYWRIIENAWRGAQREDGGWGYRPNGQRSYASMTAAGAATLFITNDFLHGNEAQSLSRTIKNEPLEKAMAWLSQNYAVDHNPGLDSPMKLNDEGDNVLAQLLPRDAKDGSWVFYMLFGYERAGEASGLTRFGERKWYDEGAYFLTKTQAYDGSWTGDLGSEVDTAYALLFLSRGRAPVAIQKLQFEGRWNNRSRDAAAFIRFMRRASERHMNWQIVSIDATPAEFREAPILYLASDKKINFTREQKERIRNYIDQGGLLLCVNEGPNDEFARSIVAMMSELYPKYEFRNLSAEHQVFTANFPVEGFSEPIRGLSNGIRELAVLFDKNDVSWKWQSAGGAYNPRLSPYGPLANLLLYVTDKSNPRCKGDDSWADADPAVKPNNHLRVAGLKFNGNWDPEPAAWSRLRNIMHNDNALDLRIETIDLATGQTIDRTLFPIAHMTSTAAIDIPDEQLAAIKTFTDQGGLLLLDAAGGSNEAAISFEAMLNRVFGKVSIAPLPLDHPIYRGEAHGGKTIEEVSFRRSTDRINSKHPRLKSVTANGKLVAILSNEDLTAGLVGYATAGPSGYAPQSATDLVRNIILWSQARVPK